MSTMVGTPPSDIPATSTAAAATTSSTTNTTTTTTMEKDENIPTTTPSNNLSEKESKENNNKEEKPILSPSNPQDQQQVVLSSFNSSSSAVIDNDNNNNNSSESTEEEANNGGNNNNTDGNPLDAIVLQANVLLETMQIQFEQVQSKFVLDRQFIMTCILTAIIGIIAFGTMLVGILGIIALLSCPLWIPVAIITSPIWITTMLFSSPIWITLLVITIFVVITTFIVTTTVVLFFGWPEEWLPSPQENRLVNGFLDLRSKIEFNLIKFQTKLLMYTAGVGPAADTAFLILDKVDINAVRERLCQVDVEKLKQFDPSELQGLVLEAIQSLAG